MTIRLNHTVIILFAMLLLGATTIQPLQATDAPDISSSLAKNLWRQAHFYFEEGMDAKATRACKELLAWAKENNEPEIEREMTDMLAALQARQQETAAPEPVVNKPASEIQGDLPACGYDTIDQMPQHLINKIVTRIPREFSVCQSDQDCTLAQGFCGANVAVNKDSKQCFEGASQRFQETVGCTPLEPIEVTVACKKQACVVQF